MIQDKESDKTLWTVESGDVSVDQSEVLRLWTAGFPEAEGLAEKYEWFYKNTQSNQAQLYFLKHDENNIGVLGIGARDLRYSEDVVRGGLLVDLTVDPAYRSIGPALKFIRGVIVQENLGMQVLYGFPNKRSFLIYKRVGFTNLGKLVRYAKVICYAQHIRKYSKFAALVFGNIIDRLSITYGSLVDRRLLKRYECVTQEGLPAGIDDFFDSVKESSFGLKRDQAFLKWRFVENYRYKFSFFVMKERENGQLQGYICYRVGPSGGVIVEDFYASDNTATLKALFQMFSQRMRKLGYRTVSLEFFGCTDVKAVLRSLGFMRRDEEPVIFWSPQNEESLKDAERWYITTADRD